MEDIHKYTNGRVCHHCVWLQNKQSEFKNIPGPDPVFYKTKNCTVTGPSTHFKYSFMVIYGHKDSPTKHKTLDFTTFINCAVHFIEELNYKYKFNNLMFAINSIYSKSKYKEHLHGFVTANSEEDEKLFDRLFNDKGRDAVVNIRREPYETDRVIDLDSKEGYNLIRSTNANKDLMRFLNLKDELNLARMDFVLFLYFDAKKGTVTGKIGY